MDVASLGYVVLDTAKADAWVDFATEVLGLVPGDEGLDGELRLRMDDRVARFVLRPATYEGVGAIGWELADDADLDRLEKDLLAAGAPARRGTPEECARRRVRDLVRTSDPAGHALELCQGLERAPAPPSTARPSSGFRAGDLGLGHIVLQVDALAEVVAFYTDVLGFRLSDRLGEVLYFLRCNARHHSIAFAHIGGPPRPLHIMLEVNSLDDVGSALDACLERGIRVSSLGLHTNDRMTSFYLQTPSGFEIEYGWNGLLVDEASWEAGVIDQPSVWGHHQLDPEHPPGPRPFRRLTG